MLMLALALVSAQLHDVPAERGTRPSALAAPARAVAVQPVAVATQDEPTDEAPRRRLWWLSIVGGIVGEAAYVAGAVEFWRATSLTSGGPASPLPQRSGWLMVPLAGPWLALTDASTANSGTTGLALAIGVTQLLGLGLSIFGPLITIDGATVNIAPTGVGGTF
jgi:hypothetical protein